MAQVDMHLLLPANLLVLLDRIDPGLRCVDLCKPKKSATMQCKPRGLKLTGHI